MQFYMYFIWLFDAYFSYNTGTDVNVLFYVFLFIYPSGVTYFYTPGIYAEGYIIFVAPFVCSYAECSVVSSFVRSLLSVTLAEFTSVFGSV